METLFAFDQRNYLDCQAAYRGPRNGEYYAGEYSIEPGSVIEVRAERKAVGSCSIIRMRARSRQFFRRSWTHIREDATDVAVLWFVRRGRLCVTHTRGETVARAGDFIVTHSRTPFEVECQTGDDAWHEALHVVVPMHLLRRFVQHEVRTGFCVPASGRKFAIAERLLNDLCEDAGEIPEGVAQTLVEAALCVLGDAIHDHDSSMPQRRSLSDKRLADVLRYVDLHLSDPKLTNSMVARGCGISTRYLSLLLRQHGTTLSALIWDNRLKRAGEWLAMSNPEQVSISEVAYRVGFKSAAHFSRMFKRAFQLSPREYRAAGHALPGTPPVLVADLGQRRH